MASQSPGHTIWLSGAVLTLLNKLVFPIVWVAAVGGALLWVFIQTGRISIQPGFRFICAFALLATAFAVWMTARLQRVGYCGRELIVANYWREARIPFEHVEAVEPVWWYRGRMVRIRFRERTPFGFTVYYLPKWGPLRCLFAAPDRELRDLIFSSSTPL
ncbi:MAG TPA: hypothetical protein VEU62_12490 [Bryobacterales bacterium]|nr:hypothetical protein [Bryobacterales bacterium]